MLVCFRPPDAWCALHTTVRAGCPIGKGRKVVSCSSQLTAPHAETRKCRAEDGKFVEEMGLGGTVDLSERTCDKGENNLEYCSKSYDGWMMDDGRTSPANSTENAIFNFPRNATQNKTRKNIFPPTNDFQI